MIHIKRVYNIDFIINFIIHCMLPTYNVEILLLYIYMQAGVVNCPKKKNTRVNKGSQYHHQAPLKVYCLEKEALSYSTKLDDYLNMCRELFI